MSSITEWHCGGCGYVLADKAYLRANLDTPCSRCEEVLLSEFHQRDISSEKVKSIFTEITIIRGSGVQADDGSVDWDDSTTITRKGLVVQEADNYTIGVIESVKLTVANVIGAVYQAWNAKKTGH